jgi:filamentous hemagglutinin
MGVPKYVIQEHGQEFAAGGINTEQLPQVLMEALTSGKVVGYQGRGLGRPIIETTVNGQPIRVAITVANNGYIVGANYLGRVKP